MTRVDFHTNVSDPLIYACRLARKAYQAAQPLVVLGQLDLLRTFDKWLWTFFPLDFIPHCMASSPLADETPVVLTIDVNQAPHYAVLLNLGSAVSPQFSRFNRLLEVISKEESELMAGRKRYRVYRDRGYILNMYQQG
ncbi:DNA polymerase III subunit chi [Candidatus Vallotia cooleyia]|uniref:DNA polymerase III subunit chi n=1 Tax=Candidatus Vallotiella adelgis TaxID=1177211 RepID=UPI001D005AFA|nr:DNA polymerase III subunit chi [Candidatus Vallotia cooleyia]UDG82115.1 DNA polymerase III subunit chi [Candidatus Vallotia cooleyia]